MISFSALWDLVIGVLPYEGRTLQLASIALTIALLCAVAAVMIKRIWFRTRLVSDPLLILLYSLPPFVTVIIVDALPFDDDEKVPFLAAGAIIYPLSVLLSEALKEGESYKRGCYVGRPLSRFLCVTMPGASAGFVAAVGGCLPWLLLATMLAELAMDTSGGMGMRLISENQKGTAAPYIVAVVMVSVGLYAIFTTTAGAIRSWLSLNTDVTSNRVAVTERTATSAEAFWEATALVIWIAALWGALHAFTPILIQSPQRIFRAVSAAGGELFDASAMTLLTTLLALVLGGFLGSMSALIAKSFPRWSPLILGLLFPLQIVPLIVFVPWLVTWRLSLVRTWAGAIPGEIVGIVPLAVPSLTVATLVAAYAFYEVGRSQLARLPMAGGGLLAARRTGDIKILTCVEAPWLLLSTWEAMSVAMPRALLAVLVTEVLVTSAGLGGYLTDQRNRTHFAEAWAAVLLLLSLVVVLRLLTNPVFTRSLTVRRTV